MNPIQLAIEALESCRIIATPSGRDLSPRLVKEALTSLRSLQKEVEGGLPEPAFRLKWRNGMYWVDKPSIGDTDVYTADQLRTAVAAALGRGAVAQITPAQAMDALKEAFVADPSYAWTWHCGVWAAAYDEGMETSAANRAAARLMSMAFDVDTSKHENFAATQASAPSPEATKPEPIDMVLYCPNCGKQHIDAPERFTPTGSCTCSGPDGPCENCEANEQAYREWASEGPWTNPPHRSHLCHHCGCIWRPADVPTNGAAHIETKGKADTWVGKAPFAAPAGATQPTQAEAPLKLPGMAVQALAGEIVEALRADEKDGGYDLEAGLFGPSFSALVRRWAAAEWPTQPTHDLAAIEREHLGDFDKRTGVYATQPPQAEAPSEREALIDLITRHLSGTYHCTRVWEAWRVGTMGEEDFGPVDESDTPAELADAILAALATQQAVQGEPVALSTNPITARAQVVSMRIKARDKDPYRPGNDVLATPPAPGQVERVDALLPDIDTYRAKYANVLTLTDDMCYGYECAREELRAALAAQPAAERVGLTDARYLNAMSGLVHMLMVHEDRDHVTAKKIAEQIAANGITATSGKESGNG